MHRTTSLAVTLLALALTACTHDAKQPDPRTIPLDAPFVAGQGKPSAPVAVSGELGATHAHLVLTFQSASEHAVATVAGVDGLTVQQTAGFGERGFKAGETGAMDVDLQGTGTLVVRVTGTFGGGHLDRVVSFAVGEVQGVHSGQVVTPDQGPGFKAVPSSN